MSIVAEFTITSDQFLLGRLLKEHPDLSVEIERVVPASKRVMPYVWGYGDELDRFETAMQEQSEIKSLIVLDRLPDSALYKIEWEEPVQNVITGIAETNATILEAHGGEEWLFRIRFDDHAGLAAFHNYCVEHGITYHLNRVYSLRDESVANLLYGLTNAQREVLVKAVELGYFKVPREVTFAELAEEFGISEQAVSERVRRATDKVLQQALFHNE